MRQVYFDVLLWDEPLITGLLYEKQVEPAIKEWLKSHGQAGLQLDVVPKCDFEGSRYIGMYATSVHMFEVVER